MKPSTVISNLERELKEIYDSRNETYGALNRSVAENHALRDDKEELSESVASLAAERDALKKSLTDRNRRLIAVMESLNLERDRAKADILLAEMRLKLLRFPGVIL